MQSKRKALGKGLGALLPPKEAGSAPPQTVDSGTTGASRIPVSLIIPNAYQPRHEFTQEALAELTASIRAHGVIQPVAVVKRGEQYMLVAGERRWRASKMAGITDIPAIALDLNDQEILEFALVENLQRENLNAMEEARAYRALIETFGLRQEEVADRIGKGRPTVANALRLLKLPLPLQKDVESGLISAGHARALLTLEKEEDQRRLRDSIVRDQLSVRDAERLAVEIANRGGRRKGAKRALDPDTQRLREQLIDAFSCRVDIKTFDHNRGKIEIYYDSLDELERILSVVGVETS